MVDEAIARLLAYVEARGLIAPGERRWAANQVLDVLRLPSWEDPGPVDAPDGSELQPILDELLDDAYARGVLVHDTVTYRDLLDTEVMGRLTPRPAQVAGRFRDLYARSPKAATDWFYSLAQDSNYIRQDRIALGKCGYYAMSCLLNQIPIGSILLRTPLIVRESTGPAPESAEE